MQDTFYNLNYIENKRAFLEDCISRSYRIHCDELDCSKSLSRVKIDKTANEILDISDIKNSFNHWVFIIRDDMFYLEERDYIEAGIRTGNGPDYFIWIYIKLENLNYFVKKYDLKKCENAGLRSPMTRPENFKRRRLT